VVETPRLVLRRFNTGDAAFALRLLNERSFLENIGDRGVRTLEQAVRYLEDGPIASYARHGHGLNLVALRDSQQPIGMCGLLKREALPDVDIGYAFLPEFWSKGYARESVAAVLAIARTSMGLKRVAAIVSPGNAPSIRLLEEFGFALSGSTRLTPDAPEVPLYLLSR
jgi:ribosomal-protein-alanine N-acetyltransferase